jgi:hypothetical protein
MSTRLLRLSLLSVVLSLILTSGYAQDVWLGGTGNWSNAADWSTGIVPNSPTVDVRIDNGNPVASFVTFDLTSGSVGDLILDPDDTLIINNGALTSYFATLNSGSILLQNGGTLNSYGLLNNYYQIYTGPNLSGSTLNSYGVLNNYGGIGGWFTGINNSSGGVFNNYGGIGGWFTGINNSSGGVFNNYGAIHIDYGGSFGNAGVLNNYGSISVTNDLGGFGNSGTMYNYGSVSSLDSIGNSGALYNSGNMSVNRGSFVNSGTIYNSGTISTCSGFCYFSNSGTIYNNAIISSGVLVNDGTINNTSGGYIANHKGFLNNGTVVVASGATLTNDTLGFITGGYGQSAGSTAVDGLLTSNAPIQIDGGILSGSGVIQADVMMGGTMSPGDSPGKLRIIGNYTQLSGGTFFAQLAGLMPGTQYSQLQVSGTATLDGTLDVVLLNGFVVHLGNSFVLMTFADEIGQFSTLDLPALSVGEMWLLTYNAHNLTLSAVPSPEPSSLLLFGTTLLAGIGALRRQFAS